MPSRTFPFCTSHHQNSVSLTLCAHFQYFKKPSSLLSNFLSNSFLSSLCSVSGCNMTFRLCFFQPDFLFCHVSLHSVVLNILLCPPFSMVHPTTISLPLPPPLLFFSCLTPVLCSLWMSSFLIIFSYLFCPFILLSRSAELSSHPCCTSLWQSTCVLLDSLFSLQFRERGKGHAVTYYCLANNFCHCHQIWPWLQLGTSKLWFPVQLVE